MIISKSVNAGRVCFAIARTLVFPKYPPEQVQAVALEGVAPFHVLVRKADHQRINVYNIPNDADGPDRQRLAGPVIFLEIQRRCQDLAA